MSNHLAKSLEIDLLGSATTMLGELKARRISAEELLRLHLRRIDELNPVVNAVVTIDVELASIEARESDARRATDQTRGVLDGLPMTVKDCLRTVGLRTTAGVPFLRDHIPAEDAGAVARIRQAGGVIFGKTNTPAMLDDLQTYNPVFGLTRNPWNLDRTPGGSSGGSGVALAMGFTPLEVGSDIAGSVRLPAHACGIYAHKPTYDVIPERGHIPPPPGFMGGGTNLATVGPMARTAEDLALLFEVLATPIESDGFDWRPNIPAPRHRSLKDFRVAVWTEAPGLLVDAETKGLLDTVAAALARSGVRVDPRARPFNDVNSVIESYQALVVPILSTGLPADIIADLPRMAAETSEAAGKYLKLVAAGVAQLTSAHAAAKEVQAKTKLQWRAFFKDFDALICPVMPRPAYEHLTDGLSWGRTLRIDGREEPYWDQMLWCGALANFAQLPATARPVLLSRDGLPMGIQIVGPFMEDRTTLELARLLDPVFGEFKAPELAKLREKEGAVS